MGVLINSIKIQLLIWLLKDLCDHNSCGRNCPAYLRKYYGEGCPCAQWHVIEQALQKWGLKKPDEKPEEHQQIN